MRLRNLRYRLVDDEFRYQIQMVYVPVILGLISVVMSVLNYFTSHNDLMWATLVFGILSCVCAVLPRIFKKSLRAIYIVYMLLILAMILVLLISCDAEGFSAIWICLLPSFGLLLWGKKDGSILCSVVFAMLVLLMWTPAGDMLLHHDHFTPIFQLRFPLVFLASYVLGYFFEATRKLTYDALKENQEKLLALSHKDGMTGIYNHAKFTQDFNELINDSISRPTAFIYIDINGLKRANDTQTHEVGDRMIYTCVNVIKSMFGAERCYRMGGDEFIVMLTDCTTDELTVHLDELHKAYNKCENLSVAIGSAFAQTTAEAKNAIIRADADMQREKTLYYETAGIERRVRSHTPKVENNNEA